jgi:hypothetical protein
MVVSVHWSVDTRLGFTALVHGASSRKNLKIWYEFIAASGASVIPSPPGLFNAMD